MRDTHSYTLYTTPDAGITFSHILFVFQSKNLQLITYIVSYAYVDIILALVVFFLHLNN